MSATAHDPERRAETAVRDGMVPMPELTGTEAPGRKMGGGHWRPVQGPYLRPLRQQDRRSRTGVPGISYGWSSKGHGQRSYRYFFVQIGRTSRKFNITTLGKEEAWRRALRCRAEHERRVAEANRQILAARAKNAAAIGA